VWAPLFWTVSWFRLKEKERYKKRLLTVTDYSITTSNYAIS
jgi:hypothetical protein